MLKQILTYSLALLVMYSTYGQIGIGTQFPDSSSVLDIVSPNAGVLIPRMNTTERDAITAPATGLIIFNTDKSDIEINYGTPTSVNWGGIVRSSMVIQDCTGNGFSGTYVNGFAFSSSNIFSVTVTNNSFNTANMSFSTSDLSLNGVGGITVTSVTPPSVALTPGASQLVEYTLTGTPATTGVLIGSWTKLGLNCIQQVNVVSGDATFNVPQTVSVVSLIDGSPLVDIQGVIDNVSNQITVNLPYTGGIGTYEAFTGNYVSNNMGTGEGGDMIRFRLSYPGGTFSASGVITATIEVDGDGSFNAKKQLFGIQETIAYLDFRVNGNVKGMVDLKVVGGITDRNFSDPDHKFIYLPVNTADGRVWLNNNLGANYANINHPSFNPLQQATADDDYHAYGSSYQWGRFSDGHELMTYTNSFTGVRVNGTTTIAATSDSPSHKSFIELPFPHDWRIPANNNLWQGESGINNPCPLGYRLPTSAELANLLSTEGINNSTDGASSSLGFTNPGFRHPQNGVSHRGVRGYYWTQTIAFDGFIQYQGMVSFGLFSNRIHRGNGLSVRCIKD